MQQLQVELKNVPTDAPQVCSSINSVLNRDESLSVQDKVLTCNNTEVDHQQHRAGQNSRVSDIVYVFNQRGNPLMPCRQRQSRNLLKGGKAKVVKRFPFTIQLLIPTGETKQETTLGLDIGFGNIGFSVVSQKEELISGTLKLDGRTKERLAERRMYRRFKRSRHHWYRKPRFLNRKFKENWLPPSIERRYQTHLNLISKLKKILPITNIILEIAKFDIQKIENPDILSKDYQQGNLYEYQNIRSYLMSREHGICQFCNKEFTKGQPSHIHHIKPKSKQGNNRVGNLAILHKECHEELHRKHLEYTLKSSSKDYKHSTFMNIINKRFYKDIPNLKVTYGNITFVDRNALGLEKTHYNDAFVIAKGINQTRTKPLEIKQVHRNNRVLQVNRKGYKPSTKREKSKVNPGDLFWVDNKQYSCKSMFSKGSYILYGDIKKKEYFNFKKVEKIFHFGSFINN